MGMSQKQNHDLKIGISNYRLSEASLLDPALASTAHLKDKTVNHRIVIPDKRLTSLITNWV
jgi:hypothetical protein